MNPQVLQYFQNFAGIAAHACACFCGAGTSFVFVCVLNTSQYVSRGNWPFSTYEPLDRYFVSGALRIYRYMVTCGDNYLTFSLSLVLFLSLCFCLFLKCEWHPENLKYTA